MRQNIRVEKDENEVKECLVKRKVQDIWTTHYISETLAVKEFKGDKRANKETNGKGVLGVFGLTNREYVTP